MQNCKNKIQKCKMEWPFWATVVYNNVVVCAIYVP